MPNINVPLPDWIIRPTRVVFMICVPEREVIFMACVAFSLASCTKLFISNPLTNECALPLMDYGNQNALITMRLYFSFIPNGADYILLVAAVKCGQMCLCFSLGNNSSLPPHLQPPYALTLVLFPSLAL